jgi:XTP/dITP diphosphohydrolase
MTPPVRVVLATSNRGKVRELQHAFPDIVLVGLAEFPHVVMPPETGATFEENATAKAKAAALATAWPAMADDSGLEVDALAGAPGIHSARFAGEPADDARNRALLRARLAGVDASRRTARFVCALALALPDGTADVVRGECEGRIGGVERGSGGFGYDALFVPNGEGRTFAEMGPEEKDRISHRGRAIRAAHERFLAALRAWETR